MAKIDDGELYLEIEGATACVPMEVGFRDWQIRR